LRARLLEDRDGAGGVAQPGARTADVAQRVRGLCPVGAPARRRFGCLREAQRGLGVAAVERGIGLDVENRGGELATAALAALPCALCMRRGVPGVAGSEREDRLVQLRLQQAALGEAAGRRVEQHGERRARRGVVSQALVDDRQRDRVCPDGVGILDGPGDAQRLLEPQRGGGVVAGARERGAARCGLGDALLGRRRRRLRTRRATRAQRNKHHCGAAAERHLLL
jgi:hypothetical protein